MAKTDTTSTVTLILNGQQTKTSLKEISQAVRAYTAELSRMKEADNPKLYREKIDALGKLKTAQAELRKEIMSGTEANKGFFADFKKGFSEIDELAGRITAGTIIYKGVSAAIEGLRSLISGSKEAYDESVRTQTQLQNVLKTTGGVAGETKKQLEQYQETLMNQTGVDDDVIAKGEEMLLTFTNIRGKIYEQALPAIVDMTAAMNGGQVSMTGIQQTAIQVGKALNDPILGVTALRKVGVMLDDQQNQNIKTMVQSNNMMGAQAIILKELQKEFGGTAKAIANTDVGKIQAFDTAIGNLKEKIGAFLVQGKGLLADFLLPIVQHLGDAHSAVEQISEDFYKQKNTVGDLEKNTIPLLDRYDQLTTKSSLTKDEQVELNKIINTLATNIPTAVTEWDKYGNAISINTDKARDFIKMQQAMLKIQNKDAIDKTNDLIKNLEGKQHRIQAMLNSGITTTMSRAGGGGLDDSMMQRTRALTDKEILDMSNQLKDIKAQIDEAKLGIKGLQGENIEVPKTKVTPPQSGPTQAEIDAENSKKEQAKREQQAYADGYKALNEKLKEFGADQLLITMSNADKEIQALQNKYDKEISDAQTALDKLSRSKYKNADDIKAAQEKIDALKVQKNDDVNALIAKQEQELTDKIIAFRNQLAGREGTELDKRKVQINKFYDDLAASSSQAQDVQDEIELSRISALNQAKLDNTKTFEEAKARIEESFGISRGNRDDAERSAINKRYDDIINDLKKKFKDEPELAAFIDKLNGERKESLDNVGKDKNPTTIKGFLDSMTPEEKARQLKETTVNAAQETADAVFQIGQANRQRETDIAIAALEKQKEKELSNKNLTEAQKQAINDKYAKKEAGVKLKQWKADQKAQEEAAVIQGALNVVKAFPNPFAMAAAAALTVIQVATIASQKPPQFAKGGLIVDGPGHKAGGVNLVNNQTGQTIAEVEGGEALAVLSRATVQNNGRLIRELLYNSQHRNGAPVTINTEMATRPAVTQYSQGGAFSSAGNPFTMAAFQDSSKSSTGDHLDELRGLRQAFERFAEKPWEFPMRQFLEQQERNDAITRRAKGQ